MIGTSGQPTVIDNHNSYIRDSLWDRFTKMQLDAKEAQEATTGNPDDLTDLMRQVVAILTAMKNHGRSPSPT